MRRGGKKIVIAIVGGLVALVGLVLIPYPGPGWLVVFAGLSILGTEFEFARKLLENAKRKYDQATSWLKRQNVLVQLASLAFTGLVVIATVYFIDGFGILNDILSLKQEWLISPLFR